MIATARNRSRKTPSNGQSLAYRADKAGMAALAVYGRLRNPFRRLDDQEAAEAALIDLSLRAGGKVGLARGGWHAVQGLDRLARLTNPTDILTSAPGQSVAEQTIQAGFDAGQYIGSRIQSPHRLSADIQNAAEGVRRSLDPGASPAAANLPDELRRNFDIGMNQGELVFDGATAGMGSIPAKVVLKLTAPAKFSRYQKYIRQGFSPKGAAILDQPLSRSAVGHHNWAVRNYTPKGKRPRRRDSNGKIPWTEGPYNIKRPLGITKGEMAELHYKIDPFYRGFRLSTGEKWEGAELGFKKYPPIVRHWMSMPEPLQFKAIGGGNALGVAGYNLRDRNSRR